MQPQLLRDGIRVSVASIVWTVITSAVAIAIGVATSSLVLVAFGLTGVFDAAGSATLVVHFRHGLRHQAISDRYERVALRAVTTGLLVVGVATGAESVHRLVVGTESHAGAAGVVLASASAIVLAALAYRKRGVAERIPSRALLADSWLSATGCLLAIVTVGGTVLTARAGWWWADAVAAAAVAAVAIVL